MTCLWLRDRADQDCQGDIPGAWPILKSRSLDTSLTQEIIEKAALADDSPTIPGLAWAYLHGNRFHIIPKDAHTLFTSLAETGDPESQMGMAFLYAKGSVVTSSQSQALLYYTFGAFGGSHWAQMALGYRYWSGMGAATSCEKALDYYRRVAQAVAAAAYRGSDSRTRRITGVRAAGCWTTT